MWLVTGNLLATWWEMWSLGLEIVVAPAFHLWLSCTYLSASGKGGKDSQLAHLWYPLGHNPLFCERVRDHSVVLEPSQVKRPWFFFALWCSHGLSCYVTLVSQSVLRAFNPGPYSKDWWCSLYLLTQPPITLQAQESVWTTSPLLLAIQHEFCGDFFSFCSFAALCDTKAPTDANCEKVFYCMETSSLSQLLPRTALHPYLKSFCLYFYLYLLSYLILKRLVYLSGHLGSSASV